MLLEDINKLTDLGWVLDIGYDGIEDEDTNLRKQFNLSATTCSGDYSYYSNATIISELWIEYTIYPNTQSWEYIVWREGVNPCGFVPEVDNFENVLEESLANTLFVDIEFPEFEVIINSDNKLRRQWYDLVQIKQDYNNSLDDYFEKGDYFIYWINNCNYNGEASIYYPISKDEVHEIVNMDIDEAADKMESIVALY